MSDRTTKVLLGLVGLGLFANAIGSWVRPPVLQALARQQPGFSSLLETANCTSRGGEMGVPRTWSFRAIVPGAVVFEDTRTSHLHIVDTATCRTVFVVYKKQ
jgi:hypothetical protein